MSGSMSGVWKRSHGRATKQHRRTERGRQTDMLDLQPPRHTSTLRKRDARIRRVSTLSGHRGSRG